MMEILSEGMRKAHKIHECSWCGGDIETGETYDFDIIVNDGELYEWKSHKKCSKLYEDLDMNELDMGEGVDSMMFMEEIQQYLHHKLNEEEYENMMCEAIENKEMIDMAIRLLKERVVNNGQ